MKQIFDAEQAHGAAILIKHYAVGNAAINVAQYLLGRTLDALVGIRNADATAKELERAELDLLWITDGKVSNQLNHMFDENKTPKAIEATWNTVCEIVAAEFLKSACGYIDGCKALAMYSLRVQYEVSRRHRETLLTGKPWGTK